MTITKQAKLAGAEIGAAVVLTIALGAALKDNGGLVPALPLLLVAAYWAGKVRQSGLGWSYFQVEVVDTPLARNTQPATAPPAVPASPEGQGRSNVLPLRSFAKPDRWWPCRPCVRNFDTEADLLAHQLEEHGDDLFKGLEAA